MEFVLKDDVLNAVLNYLASRPYNEVAGLIKAIHENATVHGEQVHEEKTIGGDDQEGQKS